MKKKIYTKSWFWVAVILSVPLAAWLYNEYQTEKAYRASVAPYHQMYEDAMAYDKMAKESIAQETAMLRADTYGGATPEETLALFVEALEARDATLASKYYMPWLQDDAEKDMEDWIMSGVGIQKFITTCKTGILKIDDSYVIGLSVDVYESSEDQYPYVLKMELNEENNIWKITEF